MKRGIVLQVAVHGNNDFAERMIEPSLERGRLAEVTAQPDHDHARIVTGDFGKHAEGAVAAAVVHEHDFVRLANRIHRVDDLDVERSDALLFVEQGHDDGISERITLSCHRVDRHSISIVCGAARQDSGAVDDGAANPCLAEPTLANSGTTMWR
jgi:hypothetical protein